MRKYVSLVLTIVVLLGVPVIALSPLLVGAPLCVQYAKNDVCTWQTCQKQIDLCSNYSSNQTNCTVNGKEVQIQINMFTCVTYNMANSQCVPVTKDGNAAYTDCVITYNCKWDNTRSTCVITPA